jgi:protease II
VRVDDYYWLRERDNPEVTAYLEAENAYVTERFGHTQAFQAELFDEIKGRIKQTDVSVPYREGTHFYYWRYEDGKEYRIYCRKPCEGDPGDEQVILDVNDVASDHEYCDVGALQVSPNERILAYAADTVGRRQYTIRFLDLASGNVLPDEIKDVTSNLVWANDNRTVFYTRQHPTTLRSFEVCRHRLGQDASADARVYEETDETFNCGVGRTRSKRYILVASSRQRTRVSTRRPTRRSIAGLGGPARNATSWWPRTRRSRRSTTSWRPITRTVRSPSSCSGGAVTSITSTTTVTASTSGPTPTRRTSDWWKRRSWGRYPSTGTK